MALLLCLTLNMACDTVPGMAKRDEYVCSPMAGHLVRADGTPVVDTEIRREWSWRGKRGQDTARTEADGRFSFGGVLARRGFFGHLPAEEAVSQKFYAELADGPFEFLYIPGSGLELNWETAGQPFELRCVVGVEPGPDGFHWGTCTLLP